MTCSVITQHPSCLGELHFFSLYTGFSFIPASQIFSPFKIRSLNISIIESRFFSAENPPSISSANGGVFERRGFIGTPTPPGKSGAGLGLPLFPFNPMVSVRIVGEFLTNA